MKVKVDTSIDPQQLFQSLESSYGPFKGAGYPLLALHCAAARRPLFALPRALLSVTRAAPCSAVRYSRCSVHCYLLAALPRAPLSVFRAAPTDQSSIIIPIIREFGSNHQQQSLESCKSII